MKSFKLSPLQFNDYVDYLNIVAEKYNRDSDSSSFNVKEWSTRLGYNTPSTLSMVLNRSRVPSQNLIKALSEDLKLSLKERQYLALLVELEKKKRKKQNIDVTLAKLSTFKDQPTFQKINLPAFSNISNWYCLVIKQLTRLKNFKSDEKWIKAALRHKVSVAKIKKAIENLIATEVLSKDSNGHLIETTNGLFTGNDIPSRSIKNHHTGMIQQSLAALEEQSVDNRAFHGLTLCLEKEEDLERAKEQITQFIKKFNKSFARSKGDGNCLYQLNLQFFEHTASNLSKGDK